MTTISVRCKMRCQSKTVLAKGSLTEKGYATSIVEFFPAYGPGNESWSKHTPSGSIKLSITNQEAMDAFEIGEYYFVDFAVAAEPAA
jgi:hypothetical protein